MEGSTVADFFTKMRRNAKKEYVTLMFPKLTLLACETQHERAKFDFHKTIFDFQN